MKVRALKAIPYQKIRMPGDEFECPERYGLYFVRAKLAEVVDGEPRQKRAYRRRDMTAEQAAE